MRKTSISIVALCVVLLSCAQTQKTEAVAETEGAAWAGDFSYGGLGYSAGLSLFETGYFSFSSRTCPGFPESKSGKWSETENMVYLEPAGEWGEVEHFRFLRKHVSGGDQYLLPSGHNEFLYDQTGDLLSLSFFGGTRERRSELERLQFEAFFAERAIAKE